MDQDQEHPQEEDQQRVLKHQEQINGEHYLVVDCSEDKNI